MFNVLLNAILQPVRLNHVKVIYATLWEPFHVSNLCVYFLPSDSTWKSLANNVNKTGNDPYYSTSHTFPWVVVSHRKYFHCRPTFVTCKVLSTQFPRFQYSNSAHYNDEANSVYSSRLKKNKTTSDHVVKFSKFEM